MSPCKPKRYPFYPPFSVSETITEIIFFSFHTASTEAANSPIPATIASFLVEPNTCQLFFNFLTERTGYSKGIFGNNHARVGNDELVGALLRTYGAKLIGSSVVTTQDALVVRAYRIDNPSF